jgi:hypothetical protein
VGERNRTTAGHRGRDSDRIGNAGRCARTPSSESAGVPDKKRRIVEDDFGCRDRPPAETDVGRLDCLAVVIEDQPAADVPRRRRLVERAVVVAPGSIWRRT